ncbi:hypothetical protein DIPPA_23954 [Diplonema papillatum]|nr:hypothetical protein DIPPA_23954 [Diplonema papillatum]
MPSAWAVLELPVGSDKEAIKRAYKVLALRHHPDKNGSEVRFKAVAEAYQKLMSPPGADAACEDSPAECTPHASPHRPPRKAPTGHASISARTLRRICWLMAALIAAAHFVFYAPPPPLGHQQQQQQHQREFSAEDPRPAGAGGDPPAQPRGTSVPEAGDRLLREVREKQVPAKPVEAARLLAREAAVSDACSHGLVWGGGGGDAAPSTLSLDSAAECADACGAACGCFTWQAGEHPLCLLYPSGPGSCGSLREVDRSGVFISGASGCLLPGCAYDAVEFEVQDPTGGTLAAKTARPVSQAPDCAPGSIVPFGESCSFELLGFSCSPVACDSAAEAWLSGTSACVPQVCPRSDLCGGSMRESGEYYQGDQCRPEKEGHTCTAAECLSGVWSTPVRCVPRECQLSELQLPPGAAVDGCGASVASGTVCTFMKLSHVCSAVTCSFGIWSKVDVQCTPDPCPYNTIVPPHDRAVALDAGCVPGAILPHGKSCRFKLEGHICTPTVCSFGIWEPRAFCEPVDTPAPPQSAGRGAPPRAFRGTGGRGMS